MAFQQQLWSTPQERRRYEELADLYAILRTCEALEMAYTRDCIDTWEEYAEQCQKLINQFKATEKALVQSGAMDTLEQFLHQFQVVDCARALERMRVGSPQGGGGAGSVSAVAPTAPAPVAEGGSSRSAIQAVKDLTELFIYCSNLISLNHRAVDELLPQLEALVKTIDRVKLLLGGDSSSTNTSTTAESSALLAWVKRMQQMRASDELDDDDARQLLFDLNTAKAATDELLL